MTEARTSSVASRSGEGTGYGSAPMAVPLFDPRTPARSRCDAELARRRCGGCSTTARFILGPEVEAFEAEFAA